MPAVLDEHPDPSHVVTTGRGRFYLRHMSIAYPLITISVTAALALESYRVRIGSVWITGNLLFRAQSSGRELLRGMERWARAVDAVGRGYVLYPADHPKAARLVIQPLDSRYCFEVFPAQLDMGAGSGTRDGNPTIPGS